jgi:hypothetical protein
LDFGFWILDFGLILWINLGACDQILFGHRAFQDQIKNRSFYATVRHRFPAKTGFTSGEPR